MSQTLVVRGQKLHPRELEVLALAATGLTNGQIGARIGLTHATIVTYVRWSFIKLGARNRTHAVILAIALGYIAMPSVPELREAVSYADA